MDSHAPRLMSYLKDEHSMWKLMERNADHLLPQGRLMKAAQDVEERIHHSLWLGLIRHLYHLEDIRHLQDIMDGTP